MPEWIGETAPGDRIWHRAAGNLASALAGRPAEEALDELGRRSAAGLPEDRAAAAVTLALLGKPEGLVDLLGEEPPRGLGEGRWQEVEAMAVPALLVRGGPEAESLVTALRDRVPGGAVVAALARRTVDDDLTKDGDALVALLDDPRLAVRRYAILRLRELVPADARRGDDYRGDRPAPERAESVAWWRARVQRGGVDPQAGPAAAPRAGRGGE